jgi:hypothetical protein
MEPLLRSLLNIFIFLLVLPADTFNHDTDSFNNSLSNSNTALHLEEMNHTHITTNYFSKARQIMTARDGAIPHPPQTFITGGTAIHLNYTPSHTRVGVDDIAINFNIPDLHVVLSEFLLHDTRERRAVYMVGGPRRRPLINHPSILPFDHVQLWYTVHLQQMSFHNSRAVLPAQTVHASPPGPGWPKGHCPCQC